MSHSARPGLRITGADLHHRESVYDQAGNLEVARPSRGPAFLHRDDLLTRALACHVEIIVHFLLFPSISRASLARNQSMMFLGNRVNDLKSPHPRLAMIDRQGRDARPP
jgi:hypothetical protein